MLMVSLIVFQVLVFGVLIFILRKIMTQNVISATKHIDELNQDYNKKDQDIARRLETVKKEAEEIVRLAHQEAAKTKSQVTNETEAEKEKILKSARQKSEEMIEQAEKSRHALLAEIETRIAKETANKAAELIHDVLPEKFKEIVHAQWVEELVVGGFKQLNNISLPDNVSEIGVIAAFALTAEQRTKLMEKLSLVLNRAVTLKEEVQPKLVAGLIVTVASLVFDGSLKSKIMEKAR